MSKVRLLIVLSGFIFFNCSHYEAVLNENKTDNEHFVLATLWMQTSAECKALQIQAFNLARYRIEQYLENYELQGNEAVVLDIDETVLETTLYQIKAILYNQVWPDGWDEFIDQANCPPVPGAVEFLSFIDSIGFNIFYVSNRSLEEKPATIVNLLKYNFPQVKDSALLLRSDTSGKDKRRNQIENNYNIVLLIGDNLGDFADFFNKGNYTDRNDMVLGMASYFGDRFIVLPNSTYGNWEGALHPDYWKVSPAGRDSIRKEVLRNYLN
jgi:5'-nucleotidase (lipoprotein e(P4) family)